MGGRLPFPSSAGFLRQRHLGDKTVTWCALKRTACKYKSDGSLSETCIRDSSYMLAYDLHLNMYIKTNGFRTWRNVESCSAVITETNTLPTHINETIAMVQDSWKWDPPVYQILWLLLIAFGIVSLIIRYHRNEQCHVCNRPLIYSKTLCWICQLYGCEPPDPNVIARLHERDPVLRGKDFQLVEAQDVEYWRDVAIKHSKIALAWLRRMYRKARRRYRAWRKVAPEEVER